VVFSGTGTAGAYHAGVLRALHEAGVKIDLVSGCGMGVVSAMFAAIDGTSRLWDPRGLWRSPQVQRFYGWTTRLRAAGWALIVAFAAVLAPLAALAIGLLVYPIAFASRLIGLESGSSLADRYARLLEHAFQPTALPTILPRLAVLALGIVAVALAASTLTKTWQAARRRRAHGAWWWGILGAPLSAEGVIQHFQQGLWHLIRGATGKRVPTLLDVSRRYAELLTENLGQPGFRELLVTAHDLDGRRDLVFAMLGSQYRREFFLRHDGGGDRRPADALDLAGDGREHTMAAMTGALTLPAVTEPQYVTFAPDGYWRGETHRLSDRPGALLRLLDELSAAGVEQVVIVSAATEVAGAHGLTPAREDGRGRLGEYLAAAEVAVRRDAMAASAGRFTSVFQIHPVHNALGPFDFSGWYDERSDRRQTLTELIDMGHEDAYRQFIEPIIGASGERIAPAAARRVRRS
jgi:hypothetical protein